MLVVTGCGATVRSTVASNADLGKYKTWAFHSAPNQQGQAETLSDQSIRGALKQDLAARGLTEATTGQPDFLVSYHVKQQQKFDYDTVGYGFYGWPGGADVTEYTQGTLIIDFIDPQTNQVFWRGTGSEVVNHPDSPNTAKIDKAVAKIVNKYPAPIAAVPRTTM
jgi:hypothetical protein